jgi:hypothetical protein
MYEYADGSPQEAVLSFVASESSHVASAVDGVAFLLSELPDEPARMMALRTLNWAYAPSAGELDTFLRWTRETLSQQPAAGPAGGN